MKLLFFAKYMLIFSIPILLILLALNFAAFDSSFYSEKFTEYDVRSDVMGADSLNANVLDYIRGHTGELSNSFNSREKEHLYDVRGIVRFFTYVLYFLLAIFGFFLVFAAINLKVNNAITSFFGKVMVYGGILTILISAFLLISISSNFAGTFLAFHEALFEEGTYSFDPAHEMIVRLYPEQIFEDIGIRVSKGVLIASAVLILAGAFLLFTSKRKSI